VRRRLRYWRLAARPGLTQTLPLAAPLAATHPYVRLQEFKGDDDEGELFADVKADSAAAAAAAEKERRAAVPGLLNPYEAAGGDMDDL
jgi:hypothetical protein